MDRTRVAKLAKAKAALSSDLLRPSTDQEPLSSTVLREITASLDRAVDVCSPDHVKKIRQLIIGNIMFPSRITAFAKYLVMYSPCTKKRHGKLYILYIINDVLYHTQATSSFKDGIQTYLPLLFAQAWSYTRTKAAVGELVELWIQLGYYDSMFLHSLNDESKISQLLTSSAKTPSIAIPTALEVPEFLGREGDVYYDLPVSTMMMCIQGDNPIPTEAPRAIRIHVDPATTNGELQPALREAIDDFYNGLKWNGSVFVETEQQPSEEKYTYEGWTIDFFNQSKRHELNDYENTSRSGSPYSD
ncbi:uncharacterized protein V1516DRAFT_670405, partial [Lipomyces oligophaga]|uniref:uncharacterized protein n=1 Tax=Lipomyces oligophaga TaxID=45792 RepID=UPI0034CFD8FD